MKITYQTSAVLDREQMFLVFKEFIEKKTGKRLANIGYEDTDDGMTCQLNFCYETEELPHD